MNPSAESLVSDHGGGHGPNFTAMLTETRVGKYDELEGYVD